MKTELTLNALQSMNAQEYEDIRAAGSDMRRNLTHEVMREVDAPANWMIRRRSGATYLHACRYQSHAGACRDT